MWDVIYQKLQKPVLNNPQKLSAPTSLTRIIDKLAKNASKIPRPSEVKLTLRPTESRPVLSPILSRSLRIICTQKLIYNYYNKYIKTNHKLNLLIWIP